jgi:hypothetical protein
MKDIIYISDFFVDEILGGAELSDDVVVRYIRDKGGNLKTVKSQTFDPTIHKADTFIISNFVGLSEEIKAWFVASGARYIIIERDQKYVARRNTAMYNNFIAPKSEVVNESFYTGAHKVFCLTAHSAKILLGHIDLKNVEVLGCTQFSKYQLELVRSNVGKKKNDKFAIVSGKRSNKAIQYCELNKIEYDIIQHMKYEDLLSKLSEYKGIVFFSHAVETCCRLLVEARMFEMKIITDNRNGCTYEKWFKELKGEKLIDFLENKVKETLDIIYQEIQ